MSLSRNVNSGCLNDVEASPTSPKLSRDFSTLRVVSEDSFSPNQQRQDSSSNVSTVSPLEALAQLCAAEKDSEQQAEKPNEIVTATGTTPKQGDLIEGVSQNDVLCGRGGLTNHHPGNVFFRQLVRIKQESYLLASKREKAGVAREIVDLIRKLEPSGRFLKKDPKNPSVWIEIGDRKAREKTSQALREGAPELREDLQQQQQQQQQLMVPDMGLMETMSRQMTSMNRNAAPPLPRQFAQPKNNSRMWNPEESSTSLVTPSASSEMTTDFTSNRARIVSDDSVGVGYSQFVQEAPQQPHVIQAAHRSDYVEKQEPRTEYSGMKRSREEQSPCSMQIERDQGHTKRGPRLKLIKSRMEYCM